MREVWLGTKRIGDTKLLHHWAIKVGDYWYEVDGASKETKGGQITINGGGKDRGFLGPPYQSQYYSRNGAETNRLITTTSKSDADVEEFNRQWLRRNPIYGITDSNCQKYVYELADYLADDGRVNLPIPEGGQVNIANGPGGFVSASEDYLVCSGSAGKWSGACNIAAEIEGPSAGISVGNHPDCRGAMVKASVVRVEDRIGPVRAHAGLNFDTGVGVHDGDVHFKFLGFGASVGSSGVGISIPFLGLNFGG